MKGLLLVNLGSPNSPNVSDVKDYLGEFLMDEYVIDFPYWLRTFIVKGIILNTRPKKSAHAYQKVWTDEGSPLIVITEKLIKKVQENTDMLVAMAMRYGKPSIRQGIQDLYDRGATEIRVLPLYPQYAMATTKTITVLVQQIQREYFSDIKLTILPPFYNNQDYIKILSESIVATLKDRQVDKILFSYHGVPKRHIRKIDVTNGHCKMDDQCCVTDSPAHQYCYKHQCINTTQQVSDSLKLPADKTITSFQSRLGADPWLQPYTDQTIASLPAKGIKKLAVVMPAFVADCLETIEEIGIEARKSFLENGGEEFILIPCLNDSDPWAKFIAQWSAEFS